MIYEYYEKYSEYAHIEHLFSERFRPENESLHSYYDEIISLNVDTASTNALIRANIFTISEIESMSDEQLMQLNHFGKTRVKRLREAIKNRNSNKTL